jgi:hypothetical protein
MKGGTLDEDVRQRPWALRIRDAAGVEVVGRNSPVLDVLAEGPAVVTTHGHVEGAEGFGV